MLTLFRYTEATSIEDNGRSEEGKFAVPSCYEGFTGQKVVADNLALFIYLHPLCNLSHFPYRLHACQQTSLHIQTVRSIYLTKLVH